MPEEGPFRVQVSYSQVSSLCGYALKLNRLVWEHERVGHEERNPLCRLCIGLPPAAKDIKPIYGTAVHAGVEYQLTTHAGPEAALEHARRVLRDELYEAWAAGQGGVQWDDEPQMTKGWWDNRNGCWKEPPRPYRGSEKLMPTLMEAEHNLELSVPAWVRRFGERIELDGKPEVEIRVPLSGKYEGCFIKCVLDIPTTEGGLLDIKASGSEKWNQDDKIDGKLVQGHLYNLAYKHWKGRPPTYMAFHVLETGSDRIKDPIEVPYDEAAIERTLEHSIYPVIRSIEADALTPNVESWAHSPKSCEHWHVCPLGSAARGASRRIGLELVA